MKRGSSVLQPRSDAAKRHAAAARTKTHAGPRAPEARQDLRPHAAGPSAFPAATALFSPDVSTKTASDLLIRLSEATQKAQMHPGSQEEAGQQEEPGVALSPDGPGASPEPPSLTHTPEGSTATETLASELLRKLAERQELNGLALSIKEEDEPMDINHIAAEDSCPEPRSASRHVFTEAGEEGFAGSNMAAQRPAGDGRLTSGKCRPPAKNFDVSPSRLECPSNMETLRPAQAKLAERPPAERSLKTDERFVSPVSAENGPLSGANVEPLDFSGAKVHKHVLSRKEEKFWADTKTGPKTEPDVFFGYSIEEQLAFSAAVENGLRAGATVAPQMLTTAKIEPHLFFGSKVEEPFACGGPLEDGLGPGAALLPQGFCGVKTEDSLFFGSKMEERRLRAALWQDMSVNLASTLLHQLSEKVRKSKSPPLDWTPAPASRTKSPPLDWTPAPASRTKSPLLDWTPAPARTSPAAELNHHLSSSSPSSPEPSHDSKSLLVRERTSSFFFRCHACGFETEGHDLFRGHMTEHRQWEQSSFSLHCCRCEHSTNQEAEMKAHSDGHLRGDTGASRCPVTLPATSSRAPAVAVATPPEPSAPEHRCRICQRSFPGQQELLVHFQGHRQGNQYRCDRCGHLTRTANKLVEHVRVHTGERPFTCDLCPYSAKRRDSLRLHCKVKHGGGGAEAPADVHTHRSYACGGKQVQRLHTAAGARSSSSGPPEFSPLLPITTLLSLKARPASSCPSAPPPSSKHSFLGYLGLTPPL